MPNLPSGVRKRKVCGGDMVNVKKQTSATTSPIREITVRRGNFSAVSKK